MAGYPRTLAIVVDGSVGRGDCGPYSDVDILAITKPGPTPKWFSYFDDGIFVTVGFTTVKRYRNPNERDEGFYWARGQVQAPRILYDRNRIRPRILLSRRHARPSQRVVESTLHGAYISIIEYAGKLRNGWLRRDEYLVRYAAHVIAQRTQAAIIALNNVTPISEPVVWHQVLRARKKPPHFVSDYPIASGLRGTSKTSTVYRGALRLARETLPLIQREYARKVKGRGFRALLGERLEAVGL